MKNFSRKLLLSAVAVAASASFGAAHADDIQLGLPNYGGTGCPGGSVSAALSPDNKQLSILFDQYVAQAPTPQGLTLDRKSCNVAVPVTIPQGFSVAVVQVDYRGYVSAPIGTSARFNVEYFFAGQRGPVQQKTFMGPTDRDYFLQSNLSAASLVWSPCGAQTVLRINSSMIAQSNYRRAQVLATLDSADISAGLIYHLQWRRCY